MAKKKRPNKRPAHHRPATPSRVQDARSDRVEDQALFQILRPALRSDDPLDLLAVVCGFLEATDPRNDDPFEQTPAGPSLADLVESLIGLPYAETTGALIALQALTPDELLATRIGRELVSRKHPMPPWLDGLRDATIDLNPWSLTHVLGDGHNWLVGVTLSPGHALSAVIYVDHNLGTVVKDAFISPEEVNLLAGDLQASSDDPDVTVTRTDPAVTRAILQDAIENAALLFPPIESDTWPGCRPLVEWMLRLLPAGGAAPERQEWSEAEQAALQDDFFASPSGVSLDDPDNRSLMESFIWFGTDYSDGDPLRWSSTVVEVLLLDWLPRKVIAEPAYLAKAPTLLRAFVSYSHQRQGVRRELTQQTLAAVGEHEPEYQRTIRSKPPQGIHALLADSFGEMLRGSLTPGNGSGFTGMRDVILSDLDLAVGSRPALLQLSTEPLPDEEFEWAGIADDVRPRVREMLEACDRCCQNLLDVEHRTAMRRFLARAAVGDPAVFRRKASPSRGAAAVAWVIYRANDDPGSELNLGVKELLASFGVSGSVSQRADPLLRANGIEHHGSYAMLIGRPDLLTSARRAAIVALRDRYLETDR